jgi:hypothetical protein
VRALRSTAPSRITLVTLVHDETPVDRFTASLTAALPWVAFLPERDRARFAVESADTLRACASIGRYTAFAEKQFPGNCAEAKSRLKIAPTTRTDVRKKLRGSLGRRVTAGVEMDQWQYDIASGARLWYCVDRPAPVRVGPVRRPGVSFSDESYSRNCHSRPER